MSVGVVGLGLIGGSIALGLRDKFEVIGVDLDPETLRIASEKGICHKVSRELSALKGADVVFVAVPINSVCSIVRELAPYGMAIADVGSLKLDITNALRDVPTFIGTHPMAGREKAGLQQATVPCLKTLCGWSIGPDRRSSLKRSPATSRLWELTHSFWIRIPTIRW